MIDRASIMAWAEQAPWNDPAMVEQDLIICRALVDIFSDDFLKNELAFRGGTALHKLYLQPQPRYSEDIDLVQINRVLEDGITAMQLMPDGSANREYVHNHVLRTAVNGAWGESFTINEGETKQQTLSQAVDSKWNTANLSIVAFVYNDDGVEQAVKTKVR